MDTLLPILVPSDWPERERCCCRPLLEGLSSPDLPSVAITQQAEPLLVYLGPERLEWLGMTHAEAEGRAVANLMRLPAAWRTVQHATPSGSWLALELLEGPMAAERVLDPHALQQLSADRVGSESLAMGIPHRGLLLVAPTTMALDGHLASVVRGLYYEAREAGAMALSPRVFLAEAGRLVGLLS